MSPKSQLTLKCPIRGYVRTGAKSSDGLKPTEEHYRVQAIRALIRLGYPKENIKIEAIVRKFGNSGRNSMRADFAVLDVPSSQVEAGDTDALLHHALILGEVKRDNSDYPGVTNTQVAPLLDFARRDDCMAVYWSDVYQRTFWSERSGGRRITLEGPIQLLPRYGQNLEVKKLRFNDLRAHDDLTTVFSKIEDILHAASVDLEDRYSTIMQLILAKLFDEHSNQCTNDEMCIQDFKAIGCNEDAAYKDIGKLVKKAANHYQNHLPKTIPTDLNSKITADVVSHLCEALAPICLIASKRDVVQSFYMKFSKGLYKWDLAQFFTPPTITDYVIDILNPRFGEHIKDPACGGADFLTAAFHRRRDVDPNYADCIWGADNSSNAIQVAVLNMLLNGDGKSNIYEKDSLENYQDELDRFEIVVCNPPFGVKVVEKRRSVLQTFELGHEWIFDERKSSWVKTKKVLDTQEAGILFAEVCINQAKRDGGRIALIVPNGYLGNRSAKYACFREWLLRNARVTAICALPRFAFKASGADVSASIVFLERRANPISKLSEDDDYFFSVQMVESVGWNLGGKKPEARYVRNDKDGSFLLDAEGNRIVDADFDSSAQDIRNSEAAVDFQWLNSGLQVADDQPLNGWSVNISDITNDKDLTLDPKRHCKKFRKVRDEIAGGSHVLLGEIVDFLPEHTSSCGKRVNKVKDKIYRYAEIGNISQGEFTSNALSGWELPDRGKHFAESGDIFIGAIWGSVTKWCYVPDDCENLVFTNGCHRVRMKEGLEHLVIDLMAFLCTEAFATQMRGLARGSDGMAEICRQDAEEVLIPTLTDAERSDLAPFANNLISGRPDLKSKVASMIIDNEIAYPVVKGRASHVILV